MTIRMTVPVAADQDSPFAGYPIYRLSQAVSGGSHRSLT